VSTLPVTPVTSDSITRLAWADAVRAMDWRQGEHVTLIGPTGVGKTELMTELLRMRHWCVFLNTKRMDSTQDVLRRELGFRTIRKGVDLNPEVHHRFTVSPPWPKKLSANDTDRLHAAVFTEALAIAFRQTGWTVGIDELEYINRDLRIDAPVNRLLRQGRSQYNSMILGTQRPRHVTLHAYEQATHLFIWRQSDAANIVRAAELAGVNKQAVIETTFTLSKHDTLYVNTITGDMFITNTRWESAPK
jgi:hypothetical protein